MRFRCAPLISSCARYSPRSRPIGAGAGPSTFRPLRSASPRIRCAIPDASSIAPANVRDRTTMLIIDDERRIAHLAAEVDLPLEERGVVLPARQLHAVVIGIERLDDRLAGTLAAARAPDDLRQQLERPLRRAEIRQPEADVGRDDADERHAREIVSLGDHLRADQHVDLAGRELRRAASSGRPCGGWCRDRAGRPWRPGSASRTSASTRSVPKPVCSRNGAGAERADGGHRVRCSCSSGSARGATRPRRARPATRCSWGNPSCRRTAGRTRPSRSPRRLSSTSACSLPLEAQRQAPRLSARLRTRSGPSAANSSRMSTICHGRERPIEHAPLEDDAFVAADAARCSRSPSTASPTRGPPARPRAGRARSPRRGRDSAGSRPACTTRRAPRPR